MGALSRAIDLHVDCVGSCRVVGSGTRTAKQTSGRRSGNSFRGERPSTSKHRLVRSWKHPAARWVAAVAIVACLLGALYLVVKVLPERWAASDLPRTKDQAEDAGRIRTALLATLAGILAAKGAYYTHRNFVLSRDALELNRTSAERTHALDQARQITERFTRAIDQLAGTLSTCVLGASTPSSASLETPRMTTPRSWRS